MIQALDLLGSLPGTKPLGRLSLPLYLQFVIPRGDLANEPLVEGDDYQNEPIHNATCVLLPNSLRSKAASLTVVNIRISPVGKHVHISTAPYQRVQVPFLLPQKSRNWLSS